MNKEERKKWMVDSSNDSSRKRDFGECKRNIIKSEIIKGRYLKMPEDDF